MEQMPKQIVLEKAYCTNRNCGAVFKLTSNQVKQQKCEAGEKSIWLTYYDCPKCGQRHYVQIDSVRSKELVFQLTGMLGQFMGRKKHGHKIHWKQQVRFNETQRDLNELRKQLEQQYTGALVHDSETGQQVEVVFNGKYE